MAYVIGIDIGTGSTKALAVNTSGEVLHTAQISYPTINPEPTYSEQAPELIWQAFVKCISRTVTALNQKPDGVILSSAMHSLIPVDQFGSPLMNMITWADNRSASIATRIHASAAGEMIYEQSGTPIHAMSPLCKIIWLKENEGDLFKQVHKFISIKEYIWHKLFKAYEIDYSIASATGLFDIEKLTWNVNALELCEIRSEQLSKPVPTTHSQHIIEGTLVRDLGINPSTPFYIGASDGCMANMGSFAIRPGVAALTIGTSGAIRVGTTKPIFNFKAMTFNYCLLDNLFISGGPINNGGIALRWYAQIFLKIKLDSADDYAALLGEIENINPCADGLIFLPYLLGERAPIWNSDASAMFFGMRNYHTQAHFTRAVVEGISMALYSIARAMEQSGLIINRVNVSGGFVHSTIWLQILADIFNKEIHLINAEDASSLGAAYLGLKSLGLINDYDQLQPALHEHFTPNAANHALYLKAFDLYERLYKQLGDEMVAVQELRLQS